MSYHSFNGVGNHLPGENLGKKVCKCTNCGTEFLNKGNLEWH